MKKISRIFLRLLLVLFILINIVTAFHAYKFTHFYDASERPVANVAVKSGWSVAKEALFGINAYKQQNSIMDSVFEKVILTSKDGIKLEGWYVKTDLLPRGTVVMFHGHGSKKTSILAEATGFRKMGYNTFLLDFRAHGSSQGNTSTIGFFESEDVKLAYDFIKEKKEKNIILWGISMGAAAITKAMNDYPLQPKKIILEMPFASMLQAAEGRIKMMGLPAEPLATFITFWGGTENGFWAFNMKPMEFAKKIQQPTLVQWGKNDQRVQREETDAVYNNIASINKTLTVYEHCGHESLCEKEKEKWMQTVSKFLTN